MNFMECLFHMIWPVISILVGLVVGLIGGMVLTLLLSGITLIRTPMHMVKTMYVTATTQVCFKRCQYFDPLLRIVVFFLVPLPHVMWWVGGTVCCAFCGSLALIGAATKIIYENEYIDARKHITSNLLIERESLVGEYLEECRQFMRNDERSHGIIYGLKRICSLFPGIALGALPFIPFSVMIALITLYRLPINVFKTMKIAYCTVLLQWDLKILTLLTLPLVHVLFPIIAFLFTLIGSLLFFITITTQSIDEGRSPFDDWGKFQTGLKEYHDAHKEFVGGYCADFDHPTGIPLGWRGESYGLPIQKILKWQWDFVVCCFLLLLGFPVCLAGCIVLYAVTLVPGILSWWKHFAEFIAERSTANILGCWTVYLLCFVLIPLAAVLVSMLFVCVGTLMSVRIPVDYLEHGYLAGLFSPIIIVSEVADWDVFFLKGCCKVFQCLPDTNPYIDHLVADVNRTNNIRKNTEEAANDYWDRFASQCIQTTAGLLEKEWITEENVKSMDPAALQAIPAVAILTILADTVNEAGSHSLGPEDVLWKIDGKLCKKIDRPPLDKVAQYIWPKIIKTKRLLCSKQKKLINGDNLPIMTALLCTNTDETTNELKAFIKAQKADLDTHPLHTANSRVRNQLVELSLVMLRVKPFQDRLTTIFDHAYSYEEV